MRDAQVALWDTVTASVLFEVRPLPLKRNGESQSMVERPARSTLLLFRRVSPASQLRVRRVLPLQYVSVDCVYVSEQKEAGCVTLGAVQVATCPSLEAGPPLVLA